MESRLYSIRDRKVGFMAPVIDTNDETARRNFSMAVINRDSLYMAFPDDYDLYFVGTFDSESGLVSPVDPVFVCSARSCIIPVNVKDSEV